MKTTITITTRDRTDRLTCLLQSIATKTKAIEDVAVIISHDDDDEATRNLLLEARMKRTYPFAIEIREVPRSTMHGRDYWNPMAEMAARGGADLIWGLCDDAEIMTEGWDSIVRERLLKESGVRSQESGEGAASPPNISTIPSTGSRLLATGYSTLGAFYIGVEDSTPQPPGFPFEAPPYCTMPMLTRAAYEAAGFFMLPSIATWGNDLALFMIWMHPALNRVIGIPEIVFAHHCQHNNTTGQDPLNKRVEQIYRSNAPEINRVMNVDVPIHAERIARILKERGQ